MPKTMKYISKKIREILFSQSSKVYASVYLGLIFVFPVIYASIVKDFYHSTVHHERATSEMISNFEKDLKQELINRLVKACANHTGVRYRESLCGKKSIVLKYYLAMVL